MKTKAKRTTTMRRFALTAALLLILALLLAFDAINGDPLSQQWAIYRAIRYAEKLYPEETFHWDQRTAADGQFFHYVVYVQSDQSRDTNFAVQTRFWLLTDDEIRGKELIGKDFRSFFSYLFQIPGSKFPRKYSLGGHVCGTQCKCHNPG